jgi:hypothetical protein
VGLEDVEDIWDDLGAALEGVTVRPVWSPKRWSMSAK